MPPPPVPPWTIRDEGAHGREHPRSSREQGEILADVIALAEAISEGKGQRAQRGPLRMPPFPRAAG